MDRARELERIESLRQSFPRAIKQSPEYTAESLITRDYEAGLYGHYQLEGYWIESEQRAELAHSHK